MVESLTGTHGMADQTARDPENEGMHALPYTVVRITGEDLTTGSLHRGTGFFYRINFDDSTVPLVITNRHVALNRSWLEFDFAPTEGKNRKMGPSAKMKLERGTLPIFLHPNPKVDLAAIPINPVIEQTANAGTPIHALFLSKDVFPPARIVDSLFAASTVLMIGFPNGIMDEHNNFPVVRKGALATPYVLDYEGKSDFVVDIAAFGGSSGSPVFAYYEGNNPEITGTIIVGGGPKVYLLGALHSGPVLQQNGQIIALPVPTATMIAQINMMIHIGYCVKAHEFEGFVTSVRENIVET